MSLEQTIGNLEIRYANVVTFVGSSNTMVDTTTGRIQTKGIQHNSNVITDVSGPHGRVAPTLKKYPEIAFESGKFDSNETTNTYVQAGYTVTVSGKSPTAPWAYVWGIFDETEGDEASRSSWIDSNNTTYAKESADAYGGLVGNVLSTVHNTNTLKLASNTPVGAWFTIELPNSIKLDHIQMRPGRWGTDLSSINSFPREFGIWGYEGNAWTLIKTVTEHTATNNTSYLTTIINSNTSYEKIGFVITRINAQGSSNSNDRQFTSIGALKLYGYEEDPPTGDHSVDTTFKSRFNNPQLTGVQVLVDGATGVGTNQISGGPDPSGNQVTMTSPNKYWTLNGTLTSNLAVEANTFLEGDQPHTVSVWFNSSNLEANVSNTCVFSIASEEKLDSVNLDLQSNTWHNLTYAYQGEGGSKVTYLDGRKVVEDQAEDTFGEYPPFAMTGYSQDGYVVSATNFTSTYYPWTAFDGLRGDVGKGWFTDGGLYTIGGDGAATSSATEFPVGTGRRGEYLDLEMPHKLKVSYFVIQTRDTSHAKIPEDSPHEGYLYGSNDGINWTEIKFFSGLTYGGAGVNSATEDTVTVNSTTAYKHLRLQATKRGGAHGSDSYVGIGELKYYGHRENDLVRLPDPTNVLKYPHIAMTGPAQRGYVASASEFNTEYPPWEAFDDKYTDISSISTPSPHAVNRWQPNGGYANTGTPRNADGTETTTLASGSSPPDYDGEWLQLESPNKMNITSYRLYNSTDYVTDYNAHTVVLLGSNTGIDDWVDIGSGETVLSWSPNTSTADGSHVSTVAIASTSGNTGFYKYHRLVVTKVTGANLLVIYQVQLFGTEEGSVPIQIGGGNIDKVANFRVYDKFIGEDQVNEIWNAQKEEFGRAKPQMVLQQGKLGIGTDAPQGSLSVADEPHNLEEFPPRAMSGGENLGGGGGETYFTGYGKFRATASNSLQGTTYGGIKAFNKANIVNADRWRSNADFTNGVANTSYVLADGVTPGVWIKLEMPLKIKLASYEFVGQEGQGPADAELWASNDDTNWTKIHSFSGNTIGDNTSTAAYSVNSENFYKIYAMVVLKTVTLSGIDATSIKELKFFGTREQGQSVLHDGQLTLTKSLNVPRIGPALDADDTPRRDRLVVEYNTSTNPTFEGAVRDTSGRGVDGIMHTATYNASEKAIESNGNSGTFNSGPGGSASGNLNDYGSFETVLPSSLQGNPVFTVSGWFKQNTIADLQLAWLVARNLRVTAQPGISNKMHWFGITSTGRPRIALGGGGNLNLYYTDGSIKAGSWHHMVVVIEPTGTDVTQNHVRFYLDGVHQTTSDTGSSGTIDLGDGAPPRMHWLWQESSTVYYDGSASNIKLHDTALTTEEVKTLYNMGRNGSVVNPQPLHIEAPLYAPGTIVQVQYASTPLNNTVRQLITGGELSDAANDVDYLDMTFKPKFANSSILLTAMINNTCTHVASFGFKEDGTIVRTQADNTNSTGGISTIYDGTSEQNRMYNINIQVMVPANGTHTRRYNVAANSYWADVNYNLYINDRNTINSMSSISNMVVYEIVN